MPEAEVTEPVVVEGAEGEQTPTEPTAEEIAAWRSAHERVTELGGLDAVNEAANLRQQLSTDEGVVAMFIESGKALGLGTKDMEALFDNAQKVVEEHVEETGDKPLTKAEVMQLVQEAVLTPLQAQQAQQAQVAARTSIDTTIRSLGMDPTKDTEDVDLVLRLADKYVDEKDMNPDTIAAAVRLGFEDFGKLSSERKAKYVADKRETKAKVPSSTSASSNAGAGESLPEPKNVKEAAARARARLAAQG